MMQPVHITCEDYTVRKEMSEFTVELRFNTQDWQQTNCERDF